MFVLTFLIAGIAAVPAFAAPRDKVDNEVKRLNAAEATLKAAVAAPDNGIPKELLERAECIGVFPDAKKAAFVVGGEGGKGIFTCRKSDGTMGAPAFFRMGGPSIGFQVGIQESDLILLIMNKEGVSKLLQDQFTIGGEASAAIGPVGRTAQAATDAQMHAQILTWSRSRGAFAGLSIEGMVIKQNKDSNEDFYGKPVDAKEILVNHSVATPASGKSYVRTTTQVSRRS
jgi:lipid-binding SYLF domain-containing protein